MKQAEIWRPVKGQIKVKVPRGDQWSFIRWMKQEGVRNYTLAGEGTFWLPRSRWLQVLVALKRVYPRVVDLRDSRVSTRIRCTTSCTVSKGPDCTCVCGGLNHKGRGGLQLGVDLGEVQILWKTEEKARTERIHVHTP